MAYSKDYKLVSDLFNLRDELDKVESKNTVYCKSGGGLLHLKRGHYGAQRSVSFKEEKGFGDDRKGFCVHCLEEAEKELKSLRQEKATKALAAKKLAEAELTAAMAAVSLAGRGGRVVLVKVVSTTSCSSCTKGCVTGHCPCSKAGGKCGSHCGCTSCKNGKRR